MGMAFTGLDIIRFGIFVYVATWLVFFCYVNSYSRRKNQNVHKVAMWSSITVATRWFGWLLSIVVSFLLFWILPDIYVVTQDPVRTKAKITENMRRWEWLTNTTYTNKQTFYVDKYYVPFRYHGHGCNIFSSYLINETDSALVLYTTYFFNGKFDRVSNVKEFEIIPPGHFQKFDRYINNEFDSPKESFGYIQKDRKNLFKTELTINLMSEAFHDTEVIRNKIKERNKAIYGWDEKDSLDIPIKAREFVLKQLRESKGVKQGTY